MIKFFNGIKRVFVGGYNVITKKNSAEFQKRFEICMNCEDKVKLGKAYFCSHCGCELHAKTKSPEEKCLMNKG